MFEAGSITGGTITLAVACVGVGTVAFPLAFAEAGIVLSASLLLFIGMFTVFSIRHLAFGVEVLKLGSYEDMSRVLLGKRYEDAVRVMLLFLNFGVCVGYIVVLAEMLVVVKPQVQSSLMYFAGVGETFISSSSSILAICKSSSHNHLNPVQQLLVDTACSSYLDAINLCVFWAIFLFPLSLAKSMDSMRFASSMAILSTCFIMGCVVYRYFVPFVAISDASRHHEVEPVHVPAAKFNFMTLLALPIMMYSLDCQCFVFQIYNDLNPTNGNRSMWGITTVAFWSTVIACIFFFGVGAFGALSFGDKTKGNILQNYDPLHDPLFGVGYLMYSFPVVMAFVFTLFPCRDAVFNAVYGLNATNIEITSSAPPSRATTAPSSPTEDGPSPKSRKKKNKSASSSLLPPPSTMPEDDNDKEEDPVVTSNNSSITKSTTKKTVTFAGHLPPPPADLSPDKVPVYPSYHHSYSGAAGGSSSGLGFPQVVLPHSVMSTSPSVHGTTGSDVSSMLEDGGVCCDGNHHDEDYEVEEIIIDTGAFYMTPTTFYLWSTVLSFAALVVAVLTPGIVVVIGLLGAMCSSTLCFTYPALFRLAMDAHELVPFYRSNNNTAKRSYDDEGNNGEDRTALLPINNNNTSSSYGATTSAVDTTPSVVDVVGLPEGACDGDLIQKEVPGGAAANLTREEELAAMKADSNCCLAPDWWEAERVVYGDCYFYFYIRHERVFTYIMLWLGIIGCVLGTTVATYKVVVGDE